MGTSEGCGATGGRARGVVGDDSGRVVGHGNRPDLPEEALEEALGDGGAVGLSAGNPSYDTFTLANDDKFTHPERDLAGLVCPGCNPDFTRDTAATPGTKSSTTNRSPRRCR